MFCILFAGWQDVLLKVTNDVSGWKVVADDENCLSVVGKCAPDADLSTALPHDLSEVSRMVLHR